MKNDYHYIDPDHAYTDPKTGVLRNIENINDAHLLLVFESMKVSIRLEELQANPIKIKNSSSLLDIHKHRAVYVRDNLWKCGTISHIDFGNRYLKD